MAENAGNAWSICQRAVASPQDWQRFSHRTAKCLRLLTEGSHACEAGWRTALRTLRFAHEPSIPPMAFADQAVDPRDSFRRLRSGCGSRDVRPERPYAR